MTNFWDSNIWGILNLVAVLLASLLLANGLKKRIKFFQKSLIPTSVLGGIILLIIAMIYNVISDKAFFDSAFFGGNGYATLETIAYHALAWGFIAATLKSTNNKITKQRNTEVFNTGLTTVSTYLLQGIVGMIITIIATFVLTDFFPAAGLLLPFGYGQGTGQALNYGNIYETDFGFVGGKSFGLTIAAFGFLSASIGGVIHLHAIKKKNPVLFERLNEKHEQKTTMIGEDGKDGSLGKLTVQIALISIAYLLTYGIMLLLGYLIPSMKSVIFGFNFLFGVLSAILLKCVLKLFKKKNVIKSEVTNNYLLSNVSNFSYDLMIVAGIAAIRLDTISNYLGILLILGVVGAIISYVYNRFVAKKLFPDYHEQQFLAMYGMLTGTASTGIVLLREIDPDFTSPASDNLVYQNLPAIVFGFPIMLLAMFAPKEPYITLAILAVMFLLMNVLLFRSKIFRRKKKQ
ncbi:MAG: hypothetical protein IJX06_01255 [Clostridia bacterium]|nr:hypothetical protein [Clostridia bacterium]